MLDLGDQPEETKKKKKKRRVVHALSNEERKPWRDPDRNPHDIDYQYNTLYASMVGLR